MVCHWSDRTTRKRDSVGKKQPWDRISKPALSLWKGGIFSFIHSEVIKVKKIHYPKTTNRNEREFYSWKSFQTIFLYIKMTLLGHSLVIKRHFLNNIFFRGLKFYSLKYIMKFSAFCELLLFFLPPYFHSCFISSFPLSTFLTTPLSYL